MTLLSWAKEQDWWEPVLALLQAGLTVELHVPSLEGVPGRLLTHRRSGILKLVECGSQWHIDFAVPTSALSEMVQQSQAAPRTPRGMLPLPAFQTVVGEA